MNRTQKETVGQINLKNYAEAEQLKSNIDTIEI